MSALNQLKYGRSYITLPEKLAARAKFILPNPAPPVIADAQAAIRAALREPIGSAPLAERVLPGQPVAVIVSDISRPSPSHLMLPPLLLELERAGVRDEEVTIIFALGAHRRMTEEEMSFCLGEEVFCRYRVVQPQNYIYLGETQRGTPVRLAEEVVQAGLVILTSNLEFHYFAGYSGGYKSVFPGVAEPSCIAHNHKLMMDPASVPGAADSNPARLDMEEAGRFLPNCFMLTVLLNPEKQILNVAAGDPVAAHRSGAALIDKYYKIPVPEAADVVIAGCGGHPKDINLYQAQKALENAARVVKPGGKIILLAAAEEGFGDEAFEELILNAPSPQAVIEELRREFRMGAHKAALYAKVMLENKVYLVSQMPRETLAQAFFIPAGEDEIAALVEEGESIYIMPFGHQTVPGIGAV
ncbi:MAG: nickel-dependent lactate racemase [Clostridiales bacterium]|nr:nickel-dependent lactate racemase [Clostridiales bacterium]